MSNTYKFTLDKSSKKFTCPGCSSKTFKKYIYTDSGEYVADEFGRCDRENNCNYHRHPTEDKDFKPTPQIKVELPPAVYCVPESKYVADVLLNLDSPFHDFCIGHKIGTTHLQNWLVGSSFKQTAFVLRTKAGRTINIKFVKYTADGKRDKTPGSIGKLKYPPYYLGKGYLKKQGLTWPGKEEDWQKYFCFERCFYGEHLWQPDRDTLIVESEKSAVIAAFFFPNYNWLATGGNNGLKYEAYQIFTSYEGRIINLVDNDKAGYEKSKTVEWLNELAKFHNAPTRIKSIILDQTAPVGYDIADLIIYQDFKDPKQLANLLEAIAPLNYDTKPGVVPEGALPVKEYAEREFKRTKQVIERLEEANVPILTAENSEDIALSLACFGKDGLKLWESLYRIGKDSYNRKDCETPFKAAAFKSERKTAARFFMIVKELGFDNRYIRVMNPRAAEGSGEDLGDFQEFWYKWPDGLGEVNEKLAEQLQKEIREYNFIEVKNSYYFAKFDNDNKQVTFTRISNFVIRPLFLIQSKTDAKRIYEIKNCYGQKYLIDVPAKSLVSLTEFCVFIESQGNFLLQANKGQFTRIKSKLYDQTKDAEEIKTLGYHRDGFYAFANGIYNAQFSPVNETGIITHLLETGSEDEVLEKHYFIPALSSIYKDESDLYQTEKSFIYVNRPAIDFNSWAQKFYEAYSDNGIFGLCFYITSLYRDFIFSRLNFFPHLFLFGPPGTGKSTMALSLNYMFGLKRAPFMLNAGTAVGFHRTFAQFRNAVVWFDEYSNTIEFQRVQHLKGAYDGAGHVKGEWNSGGGSSNKTTTTPVLSSCIISGQELPIADNALFKRVVLLQYHQTQFTDAETQRMADFQKLQEKGLSHITGHLSQYRQMVEEKYFDVFAQVKAEFDEKLSDDSTIETRIVLNAVVMATTYKVLQDVLAWPFSWEKLKAVFVAGIRSQNNLIANAKETNQFWDQVDYLLNTGQIREGEDFKIQLLTELKIRTDRNTSSAMAFEKSKEVFFLRLSKIYPLYREALRKQGENKGMDRGSLIHYLSHSKGYLGSVDSTNFKAGEGKHTQTSAYCFDYEHITSLGYNFQRHGDEDLKPEEKAANPYPIVKTEF